MREIIREHEFDEQLERLLVDMEEADNFTCGAEYLLAHEPRSGTPSADPTVWILQMCPVRGRQIWLYYEFDERTVTFLFIVAE